MAGRKSSKTKLDEQQSKEIDNLKAQLDFFKNEMVSSSSAQLEKNVNNLNEQISKLVSININLQSKMTELLIKMTDLVRENRELISLLEEASEEETAEKPGSGNEELIFELKKIEKNTEDSLKSSQELAQYMKRMYTKNLLTKVIGEKLQQSVPTVMPGASDIPLPEFRDENNGE